MPRPPDRETAPAGAASNPHQEDPRQRITSEDNRPGSRIAEMVAPFIGKQIPGGCDYCDAYQTIEPIPGFEDTGAWLNQIHHDDWCPWWIRHRNRAARRQAVKQAKQRRRVP